MFELFKIINIINLITCLSISVLNSSTISDPTTLDSSHTNNNYNNNNNLYDNNPRNVVVNNADLFNVQFNEHLSTQSHLEESIVRFSEIENTTPYASPDVTWDTEDKLLENSLAKLKNANEENTCLLDSLKSALLWWSYSNGTLRTPNLSVFTKEQQMDLSHRNLGKDEEILKFLENSSESLVLVAFSLAYNNLNIVPYQSLELIANTLHYLSLKGNPFMDMADISDYTSHYVFNDDEVNLPEDPESKILFTKSQEGIAWDSFPYMPNLQELDMSNCNIGFITRTVFQNLTNLKSLYMSHNKMLTIPSDTFYFTPFLQILDLSFTNVHDSFMNQLKGSATLESVMKPIYGLNIKQHTLMYLPNLVYLDLSHTKLTRSSAIAFTNIGGNLKYLSLCYTSFPVFGNGIFKNTSLIGLDLSGNVHAAFTITEDIFKGMLENLMYLYFEKANLKNLAWLKHLHNLHLLALAGNNINTLTAEDFSNLKQLQFLDLTSNQVGNWYSQVFGGNTNLHFLSLRHNNINVITSEMLKDFSNLMYLSLGDNNFLCDCLLRDLVDIAAVNNKQARCKGNFWQEINQYIHINRFHLLHIKGNLKIFFNSTLRPLDIDSLVWSQNLKKIKQYAKKSTKTHKFYGKPKLRFILDAFASYNESKDCHQFNTDTTTNSYISERINRSFIKLQLLDYEEEHYWCYNETERQNLNMLDCQRTNLVEDIVQELDSLTTYVIASVGTLIVLALLGILIYWKRWHIFYYYSSLKSATLLSAVSQDNLHKFNTLCLENANVIYDIFISYCQSDRDWIIEELMPNVEDTNDISICLHERDFQIGVTILDNIVSCMERSKALMLIISSNFLLSHWCQFEMQLAQQCIFDLNKNHLILVLLEDIPRNKRPKNLQYLMDVKTYIKWPGGKGKRDIHPEERKLFWKRLKRSLRNIGLNPTESRA